MIGYITFFSTINLFSSSILKKFSGFPIPATASNFLFLNSSKLHEYNQNKNIKIFVNT